MAELLWEPAVREETLCVVNGLLEAQWGQRWVKDSRGTQSCALPQSYDIDLQELKQILTENTEKMPWSFQHGREKGPSWTWTRALFLPSLSSGELVNQPNMLGALSAWGRETPTPTGSGLPHGRGKYQPVPSAILSSTWGEKTKEHCAAHISEAQAPWKTETWSQDCAMLPHHAPPHPNHTPIYSSCYPVHYVHLSRKNKKAY